MILTALTNNDLLTRLSKNLDLRNIAEGNLVVSLHRGFPGYTGENEIVNPDYFRQAVNFNPAGAGEITNATLLQWFKKTGDTVITRTLMYSDTFNRANIPYCSSTTMGEPNWRVYTGCAAIDSNRLKLGHNITFNVKMQYDNAGGLPALAGQYTRARLRSWKRDPATGLFVMASTPTSPVTSPAFNIVGYMALVIPDPPSPSGGSINNCYVKLFRRGQLIASIHSNMNAMSEWTLTAIPFVDHTFIQIKQEEQTWIEYADFDPGRASSGYQGLCVFYAGIDTNFRSGYDSTWDDWEAGGAALSVDGGGGSPDTLITHLGFWTATEGLFLGSAKFNTPVHTLTNQILTIDIGDLKLQVNSGTDEFRNINLDRFGRGVNFTTAPLQMSLHTADPSTTGANEISGSRITVPVDTWDVATDQTVTNGTKIDFPNIATNTITHLGVWSLEGVFLFGVELTTPINATLPVQTIRFLQGRLKFFVPTAAIGFLTAPGEATVAFSGVGIAVGAASMDGIGAAAFDSSAVNVGAMSSAGAATAGFTGHPTFPGWNGWTNRSPSVAGFNQIVSIADGTDRIYYSRTNAVDSVSSFSSLLKSDLTTHTIHTLPSGKPSMQSIVPMDDGNTVFLGSGSTGHNPAMWKFTHSGGFTTLTSPFGGADAFFCERHPTNANILFWGNQSGASDDVRLYTYSISGNTFTKIGGTGLNGSWNVNGSSRSIMGGAGLGFDGTFIYVLQQGGTANQLVVWRATIDDYTDWTIIGGNGAVNGSWATGTKRNGRCYYSPVTGKLYAFIGGGTAGDAEVWECASPGSSPAWTQIGGDSINGSWAAGNWVNSSRRAHRTNRIVTGLSGTASGDSDVWEYDELALAWTKIGGDGVGSSWSTLNQVNGLHVDREDRLWASPSNNSTGSPQLWSQAVA